MKMNAFASVVGVVVVGSCALACSVTAINPGGSGGTDPGTPVKAQALSGTIKGKPFAAKVAIARPGFSSGGKSLDIYAVDATCDKQPQLAAGDHKILASVDTWADGTAFQLDSTHSVTFLEAPSNNFVTFTGRLEVVKAGTATEPGLLALRADDQSSGAVEGQIKVLNCGQ